MLSDSFKIVKENFKNNYSGEALMIEVDKLRNDYDYIGLWYAKEGDEKISLTTEFYYSERNNPAIPSDFNEELKENSFKQVNRFELSKSHDIIRIAVRIDNFSYCRMKAGKVNHEKLYVNYRIIQNKANGFKIMGNGQLKGGFADFFMLGIEDMTDKIDYTDIILFVVCIKGYPPADWNIDDIYIGVDRLPIFTPVFKFSHDKKYSKWFDQDPFSVIGKQ